MSEAPNTNPAVTSLTAKAGDKVDNYTIMEQVGAGGTAIVFRGHDHVLNRNVAIKQLVVPAGDEGDDIRQRALAEAAIHKRVAASDPKLLVQYIDTVNEPRGIFLISEYVDGPSLEWMLQQAAQPMEQRQALGIIAATAKALDALHQNGAVHRDLKPSNILMPREGGLKLADFGLAAIVAEQQTLDLGSVRYMAPELLQGEAASAKSDLYSLGIVAYEMLAGRDNFNNAFRTILRDQRNQSMRWVKWHTNVRAKVTPLDQLVEGIAPSLAQLVARMMEKDPARRVGSCAELLEAIRVHFAQAGQGEQQATAPGPHAAMAPPQIDDASQTAVVPQKSKLPMILAATLLIWFVAIGGFFIWQNKQAADRLAQQTTLLIADIEAADRLIDGLEYEKAIAAYEAIRADHPGMFDPNNRRGRDDLVEAGSLKAQALLAEQRDDYVAAHQHALAYRGLMASAQSLPSGVKTNLNLRNAKDLVDEFNARSAFQQECLAIEALFDKGELNEALDAIRVLKQTTSVDTAQADLDRIAAFERKHTRLIDDQDITEMLLEAARLEEAGNLVDGIRLLETEIEEAGEDIDSRITELAKQMNGRLQIADRREELAEARQDGDAEEILAAMEALYAIQPTQGLKEEITEQEVRILIDGALADRTDGNPESADEKLREALELDPGNREALAILATLADARMMVEKEREGDQLFADGEYAKAIAAYKSVFEFGPDRNGAITDKINNATGLLQFNDSQAAFDKGDLPKAQDLLNQARTLLGDTDEIADLQDNIDEQRQYTQLVSEGDDLFAKGSFGPAKRKYLAAKDILDSQAINEKIRDCDFGSWLNQCDGHIVRREWGPAEAALNRAEEIKKNDQTKARREKIENRVQ